MSIGKKNKDHLTEHGGVDLITPVVAPMSDDPLRFWTGHPTENTIVNLYPFSNGENKNPHPQGAGNWAGPFSGRPDLIRQLAPAVQARCALLTKWAVQNYLIALRAWWRLFDVIESKQGKNGQELARVELVSDLHALHEAAAHQHNISFSNFSRFRVLVNDARRLHKPRLPPLPWISPKGADPIRHILPEDQAKDLRIMIKQDWEAVRRTWARHDVIRAEAQRRAEIAAEAVEVAEAVVSPPHQLSDSDEFLLKNCEHFLRTQLETGLLIPCSEQLLDGENRSALFHKKLELKVMRAIFFPTVWEADIAFHLALMDSGWNPSTLTMIDAGKPDIIFDHPKNSTQWVLGGKDAEVRMKADKRRARGKTQYCYALKKNKASPPAIVSAYLERSAPLREKLRCDCDAAEAELARLQAAQADQATIENQFKKVQTLQEGYGRVWLYLDNKGSINWLDRNNGGRYRSSKKTGKSVSYLSYLGHVSERLNEWRDFRNEPPIGSVTPSDFRDIYARRVYKQTGGNILAVMLALGHSTTQSTGKYLDNNIFSTENDGCEWRSKTA